MSESVRRFIALVLYCVGLSCLLGIAVNLINANLAVDYFLVHHPKIISSEQPWALALAWGFAATWWFGAICGVALASINHYRTSPLKPARIAKWVGAGCVAIWILMMAIVGGIMWFTSRYPAEQRSPTFEYDRRLVAVAMAHQFEYLFGAIALIIIGVMVWRVDRKGQSEI